MSQLFENIQPLKKILIADDHALFRRGLSLLLKNILIDTEVIEAIDVENALSQMMDHHDFDLILLDLSMPGMEHLKGISDVIEKAGDTPVAILSAHQDVQSIKATIEMGSRGYLLKSFSEESFRFALGLIMSGEVFIPSNILSSGLDDENSQLYIYTDDKTENPIEKLTRRQRDVLNLIMQGQSNKLIARSLGLYESTVKTHIQVILEKLQAENRTHAAMIAAEWLEDEVLTAPRS